MVWSKSGFENLNIFTLSITQRGMKSRQTVSSVFFVEIVECLRKKLDEQKRVSGLHHNEKLKKKKSAVCYLVELNLPLRGYGEAQNSVNKFRGNYIELLIK